MPSLKLNLEKQAMLSKQEDRADDEGGLPEGLQYDHRWACQHTHSEPKHQAHFEK